LILIAPCCLSVHGVKEAYLVKSKLGYSALKKDENLKQKGRKLDI